MESDPEIDDRDKIKKIRCARQILIVVDFHSIKVSTDKLSFRTAAWEDQEEKQACKRADEHKHETDLKTSEDDIIIC